MTKFIAIALLALASIGCASKGDLQALSARVNSQAAEIANLKADHDAIKADHEAIKGEHADLKSLLDRLFVKKARK